jgi:hypothetical protein
MKDTTYTNITEKNKAATTHIFRRKEVGRRIVRADPGGELFGSYAF